MTDESDYPDHPCHSDELINDLMILIFRKREKGSSAYHSLRSTMLPSVQLPYLGSRCLVLSWYCFTSLFISSVLSLAKVMHDKVAIVAVKKIRCNMLDRQCLARQVMQERQGSFYFFAASISAQKNNRREIIYASSLRGLDCNDGDDVRLFVGPYDQFRVS